MLLANSSMRAHRKFSTRLGLDVQTWITRSDPGAERLLQGLASAGVAAICTPAVKIATLDPFELKLVGAGGSQALVKDDLEGLIPDVIVVVSQHAARRFKECGLPTPEAPRLAIGAATADVLGTGVLVAQEASSEGLLAEPILKKVDLVWLVAGRDGRETISDHLIQRGARVVKILLYERQATKLPTLLPDEGDIIEIGSSFGLHVVNSQWPEARVGRSRITLIAPSSRVADEARLLGFAGVEIAASASVGDMVATIAAKIKGG
jgi:uroporphyrinogen-III synthase